LTFRGGSGGVFKIGMPPARAGGIADLMDRGWRVLWAFQVDLPAQRTVGGDA
jgi:hypothetical protein